MVNFLAIKLVHVSKNSINNKTSSSKVVRVKFDIKMANFKNKYLIKPILTKF